MQCAMQADGNAVCRCTMSNSTAHRGARPSRNRVANEGSDEKAPTMVESNCTRHSERDAAGGARAHCAKVAEEDLVVAVCVQRICTTHSAHSYQMMLRCTCQQLNQSRVDDVEVEQLGTIRIWIDADDEGEQVENRR